MLRRYAVALWPAAGEAAMADGHVRDRAKPVLALGFDAVEAAIAVEEVRASLLVVDLLALAADQRTQERRACEERRHIRRPQACLERPKVGVDDELAAAITRDLRDRDGEHHVEERPVEVEWRHVAARA